MKPKVPDGFSLVFLLYIKISAGLAHPLLQGWNCSPSTCSSVGQSSVIQVSSAHPPTAVRFCFIAKAPGAGRFRPYYPPVTNLYFRSGWSTNRHCAILLFHFQNSAASMPAPRGLSGHRSCSWHLLESHWEGLLIGWGPLLVIGLPSSKSHASSHMAFKNSLNFQKSSSYATSHDLLKLKQFMCSHCPQSSSLPIGILFTRCPAISVSLMGSKHDFVDCKDSSYCWGEKDLVLQLCTFEATVEFTHM